jgi:plastocyanin
MRRRSTLPLLVAAASVAAVLTAGFPGGSRAANEDVRMSGFAFVPGEVTVGAGDTVTWKNDDGVTHNATALGGAFATGNLAPGNSSAEIVFATPGTIAYRCTIHPSMTGSVVVQGAGATPSPSPSPTNTPVTPPATATGTAPATATHTPTSTAIPGASPTATPTALPDGEPLRAVAPAAARD